MNDTSSNDHYAELTDCLSTSSEEAIVKKVKPLKGNHISNIINLNADDNKWILPSGTNFSALFISRRNDLIQQCGDPRELQVDKELSMELFY